MDMPYLPLPSIDAHISRVDTSRHRIQVASNNDGLVLFLPHYRHILKGLIRRLRRFLNKMSIAFWPAPPSLVAVIVGSFVAYVVKSDSTSWFRSGPVADFLWNVDSLLPFTSHLPNAYRVGYLATFISIVFLFTVFWSQRLILRCLLNYKGWLFESQKPGIVTKIWAFLLKYLVIRKSKHSLYAFQSSLPRLSVPKLEDTITKYLETVEPILSKEEFEAHRNDALSFQKNEGKKIQLLLKWRAHWCTNYVSDWWLKYAYHRPRGSIQIASNCYGIGHYKHIPTDHQTARAAGIVWLITKVYLKIDKEQWEPMLLNGIVPLCMDQYSRVFGGYRVPGKDMDKLRYYDRNETEYLLVMHKGAYFRVELFKDGKLLSPAEIQYAFDVIIKTVKNDPPTQVESHLAALTAEERSTWASIREQYFSTGINRLSLKTIERSLFILCLDDESPSTLSEIGASLLHGTGSTRWFDKPLTIVAYSNGKAGVHFEHSWGDGPVPAHIFEHCLGRELTEIVYENGTVRVASSPQSSSVVHKIMPQRLLWVTAPGMAQVVTTTALKSKSACDDLHLAVHAHDKYGKGFIKKAKVSPDAYIQMALQLAFKRDQNRFGLTYESSMARLFKEGRTETIRTLSKQSCAFVEAMLDPNATKEQKIKALKAASERHTKYSKEAMIGRAVDRHLFTLYVGATGMGFDSPFLKKAMSMKWELSTSQVAQRQSIKGTWPNNDQGEKYPLVSGGFGPGCDTGYGVSYCIAGENLIFTHVSSKHSCPSTNSERFTNEIARAFEDMYNLYKD